MQTRISSRPRFQFFHDSRQEGLVTCRKRGKANHMDVVIHSILCRFFRRLEQRSYVDVPAHIGKGCGENLLASVVSVLPHLSQEIRGRRPSNASNLSASFFASSSFAEPSNSLEYTPEIVWMVALKRPDTFQPHRKFHRGTHGHEPPVPQVQAGYRFHGFLPLW